MQPKMMKQEHIAFMRNPWMDMILAGTKTIESRWTINTKTPFGLASPGEVMYFKPTSCPIVARCIIKAADYFLRPDDEDGLRAFLDEHWMHLGFAEKALALKQADDTLLKTHVSMLSFEGLEAVDAFEIDKTGFGSMTGWITVDNVERIRK